MFEILKTVSFLICVLFIVVEVMDIIKPNSEITEGLATVLFYMIFGIWFVWLYWLFLGGGINGMV